MWCCIRDQTSWKAVLTELDSEIHPSLKTKFQPLDFPATERSTHLRECRLWSGRNYSLSEVGARVVMDMVSAKPYSVTYVPQAHLIYKYLARLLSHA